jgi:mono/diheme cytochrome c family protein
MKIALLIAALVVAAVALFWPRDQFMASKSPADRAPTSANIARGAYLARAGDCASCHTAPGGAGYAGGRALATPFGTLYGPNLTPSAATGLGNWSADDFWGALHNGRAPGGRYLYPAFPFPHYTKTTRADSDALYAFFRSVAPVHQVNRPHAMDFPFNTQIALAGWRLFYFRPGVFESAPAQSATWNRGAYLTLGLGHCSACHSSRNMFGASAAGLQGGMIPTQNWYAPALPGQKDPSELVQLLHTGATPHGAVFGPMAEVVANSLQYLSQDDVAAMAVYLTSLPASGAAAVPVTPPDEATMSAGRTLYEDHCMTCHGRDGGGRAPAYPPLAGNRTVTLPQAVNAVRIVLAGGFPPGTAGNPRPYGMPPFAHVLEDGEVAQLVTYVRNSWGNHAGSVTPAQVNRYRGSGAE